MQRERVSENVYWFQSEIYAQVTAGVIVGPQWAIVVDTLAMPEETKEMRDFIATELGVPVRYLIDTHSHADHAWGNCFFPGATIISHTKCAEYLQTKGIPALEKTKKRNPAFQDSFIVLPHLTFSDGELTLKVGKKNLIILLTPGHTDDGISVFVEEDRILFAGDAFMPIPVLSEGNFNDTLQGFEKINALGLENIIQGHGDIILRGEIEDAVAENINYMKLLREAGEKARKKRNPGEFLAGVDIESCGKSRVYLGGLAEELHKRNLVWIYKQVMAELGKPAEDEYDVDPDDDDFDDIVFDDSPTPTPSPDDDEDMPDDFDENDEDEDMNDEFPDGSENDSDVF